MKVFFSRPPKRCQERRTPLEPTPSASLPLSLPPSLLRPARQDREHERATLPSPSPVSTAAAAANPFEKEGRNIGGRAQESPHGAQNIVLSLDPLMTTAEGVKPVGANGSNAFEEIIHASTYVDFSFTLSGE